MNNNYQEKQIHFIHVDRASRKSYYTGNNNELKEIMSN